MDAGTADSGVGTDFPALTENSDQNQPHQSGAPFIEWFPSRLAGAPISNVDQGVPGSQVLQDGLGAMNIWSPFLSQQDWDFALWAKDRGPSSTAVTELLAMEGVRLSRCETG